MQELLFKTNKFSKPMVLEGNDALSTLLCRLILMEPGTNPLHPEMGVGLVSRYRHSDVAEVEDLEQEIKDQIDHYLPQFRSVEVKCTIFEGDIRISININNTLFNFSTSELANESFMTNGDDYDNIYTDDDEIDENDFSESELADSGFYDNDPEGYTRAMDPLLNSDPND